MRTIGRRHLENFTEFASGNDPADARLFPQPKSQGVPDTGIGFNYAHIPAMVSLDRVRTLFLALSAGHRVERGVSDGNRTDRPEDRNGEFAGKPGADCWPAFGLQRAINFERPRGGFFFGLAS